METTERRRGAKYMEGYLEVKESSKWVAHWVVIRGSQLFFFKDENTHNTENIQGHVDIGPKSSFAFGKTSKGKFEFEIKTDNGKKYFLRACSEILRLQWVHTVGLAAKGKPPPPLFVANPDPGEKPVGLETNKPSGEREVGNTYTEVPEFNIRVHVRTDAACEVTDEEMQKTFVKKHNSFSSHCKKIWGRRKESLTKSVEEEPESRQPVSEGAESTPEPFYDEFPGDKPAWYFGSITRKQAETILEGYGPGRFLVRDSETNRKPGAYTLSLKHRDRCRHHKIETTPDGNLTIKQHEDKPFPNLATLMKYFVKSQEKDIVLLPVLNEEQEGTTGATASPSTSPSSQPVQRESYEIMNQRPPAVGCEDITLTESASGTASPKPPHGYENLPNKPKVQPPPLKSRMTEPVLPTYKYENLPPKAQASVGRRSSPLPGNPDSYERMAANGQPPVGRRPSPLPGNPDSYERMAANGCPRNSSFDEPPVLPPRRPANQSGHGYENLPEKALPPREPTGEGYVNLPQKAERSLSEPPELPARSPRHNHLGYENVPSNSRSLPPTSLGYQNVPSQAHGRHSHGSMRAPSPPGRGPPPPMKRATTLPAHIIENTLGNMNINEGPY